MLSGEIALKNNHYYYYYNDHCDLEEPTSGCDPPNGSLFQLHLSTQKDTVPCIESLTMSLNHIVIWL